MFRKFLLTMGMTMAAATAIAADPPPLIETNMFAGASGWAVTPGTTRVIADSVGIGQDFAEQQVRYVRTGVFTDDVVSGGSLAKQVIPAGSPAYAVTMAGFGVGWCSPGADLRDLGARLASKNKEQCIFANGEGGMFRTQGYDGKSPFAASAMTGMYRVISPVRITEKAVDFGRPFRIVATLAKFGPKELRIDYWFDDGSNRTRLVSHKVKPAADGSFELPQWGGRLRLRPSGAQMAVETLVPVQDRLSDVPELRGHRLFSPTINIIII